MTLHTCSRQIAATVLLGCLAIHPATRAVADASPRALAPADGERLRILTTELQREQRKSAEAALRRDERAAAHDEQGAGDAEQAQRRSLEDIAALQREIASVSNSLKSNGALQAPAPSDRRFAQPVRPRGDDPAPRWWDVYAKPPRATDLFANRPPSLARPDTAAFQPQPGPR